MAQSAWVWQMQCLMQHAGQVSQALAKLLPADEVVAEWAHKVWAEQPSHNIVPSRHKALADLVLAAVDRTVAELDKWSAQLTGPEGGPAQPDEEASQAMPCGTMPCGTISCRAMPCRAMGSIPGAGQVTASVHLGMHQ